MATAPASQPFEPRLEPVPVSSAFQCEIVYGLNPTLFHNSAQLYIMPLVMTYSTLRVL